MSAAEIFRLAKRVRRDLRITSDSFPVLPVLEIAFPQIFEGFSFESGDVAEMGLNHGLTIPADNVIKLRLDVYEGAYNGVGRDRFTAAHEMGHYLMHRNAPMKFHRTSRGVLPAYRNSEWQANTFAGALLMPEELLIGCRSLREVMERFEVSWDAARVQNEVLAKKGKMGILS